MNLAPNQKGFTLLEVMAALTIFGVLIVGILPAFVAHSRFIKNAEVRTGAIQVAQTRMDELRQVDPISLPTTGSSSSSYSAGGRAYSVVTQYCQNASLCSGTAVRHIRLDIRFRGSSVYDLETIYTQLR